MQEPPRLSRRALLIAGAAAGASSASGAAGADIDAAVDVADADVRQVTLRDTDHIRTYYDLARR